MGTDLWASGSGEGSPRRGAPPAGPALGNRHRPATLPLDHAELVRNVGFRSPRWMDIAFWLAWRHGKVERVTFRAFEYVATAYCEDGEWFVTRVIARPDAVKVAA